MDLLNKTLSTVGSNKLCPVVFVFKGNMILIGLRNYTPDKWKAISVWTVPGGRCDDGETLEQALRRELKEEVGISELDITEFLGEVPGAKWGDKVCVFKAITQQEPRLMEPTKFSEWKWTKISDVPNNFINPEALKLIK